MILENPQNTQRYLIHFQTPLNLIYRFEEAENIMRREKKRFSFGYFGKAVCHYTSEEGKGLAAYQVAGKGLPVSERVT